MEAGRGNLGGRMQTLGTFQAAIPDRAAPRRALSKGRLPHPQIILHVFRNGAVKASL